MSNIFGSFIGDVSMSDDIGFGTYIKKFSFTIFLFGGIGNCDSRIWGIYGYYDYLKKWAQIWEWNIGKK